MAKFLNRDLEDLAGQLARSPRRLRLRQVLGIERLLEIVREDQAYPVEFVCYTITGYRRRGTRAKGDTGPSIPGAALVRDLVTLAETITRSARLPVSELGEPYRTQAEAARFLGVSTKTVQRWRGRGLMGIRVVYADGVNRLAFLQRTLDRFKRQHAALVERGASFRQLTEAERRHIVERARELIARRPMKLHAVAKIIARETGRAVETVRYTLRRHDAAHREAALFPAGETPGEQRYRAMWQCRQAGESPEAIASAFHCSVDDVEAALRYVQTARWRKQRWEHFTCELFHQPDADARILEAPEPAGNGQSTMAPPAGLPAYLQALYRTPLLTPEQESDLFRRYNYLKFKIAGLLDRYAADPVPADVFRTLQAWIADCERIKQRIVEANLRLVVSIAKKHVGVSDRFFEVVSDGNMSLIRAVERFDFTRGTRFSTYATWVIVKNYARRIPERWYAGARHMTGQDELLESTADPRPVEAHPADRRRVRERIAAALQQLAPREREIVAGHFGLGEGDGTLTLEQLGRRFGVTKERVRQIERRALGRLRELLDPSLAEWIAE